MSRRTAWFLVAGAGMKWIGAWIAAAAARTCGGSLSPIGEAARPAPEVEAVYQHGFEIRIRRAPPAKRFQRITFIGRRGDRSVGRLDVHFLPGERRLYVENVFVAEAHGRCGLATALLVSAAKTIDCAVVATSGRTNQGTAFFARCRSILKRHGIELRDDPR